MNEIPDYFKSEQFLKQVHRPDCWNKDEIPTTIRGILLCVAQSALVGSDLGYSLNQYVIGLIDLGYGLDDDVPLLKEMDLSKIPKKNLQ